MYNVAVRILVVSATPAEIAPVTARLQRAAGGDAHIQCFTLGGHHVDVLASGVGMVATAAWASRALAQARYDLALNLGVCGSFDASLAPGRVVHVVSDRIAELGAEDDDAFLTIDELDLPADPVFVNDAPPDNAALRALPAVRAITVNTVHGNERSIAAVVRRFAPQVESMEGAAFMCACLIAGVPFAQIRAVSNVVERRNREAWSMGEAIGALDLAAWSILELV